MRGECDPKHCYSLFVFHYSLHSRQWKRGITVIVFTIINLEDSSGEPDQGLLYLIIEFASETKCKFV